MEKQITPTEETLNKFWHIAHIKMIYRRSCTEPHGTSQSTSCLSKDGRMNKRSQATSKNSQGVYSSPQTSQI